MLFLASFLLGLSLLRPVFADIQPKYDPDCMTDDLANRGDYGIDFDQGNSFCAMQFNQGAFVSGIEVWTKGWAGLIGIKVSYTNGESTSVGNQDGDYDSIFWNPGEASIRDASAIRAICPGLCGIRILLTNGKSLHAGLPKSAPGDPNDNNRAGDNTGLLLGISGHVAEDAIDQISFHVLKQKTTSSRIHDVVFSPDIDELNKKGSDEERGLEIETIRQVHFYNDRKEEDINYKYAETVVKTFSTSWSNTLSDAWHLGEKVEVSAEVSIIAGKGSETVALDFFWERKKEKTTLKGESKSTYLDAENSGPIKAGKAVYVWSYMVQGKYDVSWEGLCTVHFDNGKEMTFPTGGKVNNVQYAGLYTHVEDEDIETAKSAVAKKNGTLIRASDPSTNQKHFTFSIKKASRARRFIG